MTTNKNNKIISINAAVSRLRGLYTTWAHRNRTNYFTLQLFYILYLEGSVTQKQIRERYFIPKQTINNAVIELKNNGYIEMETCEKDNREKRMILTEVGQQYSEKLLTPLIEMETSIIDKIGEQYVDQFINTIILFGDHMEMMISKNSNSLKQIL